MVGITEPFFLRRPYIIVVVFVVVHFYYWYDGRTQKPRPDIHLVIYTHTEEQNVGLSKFTIAGGRRSWDSGCILILPL